MAVSVETGTRIELSNALGFNIYIIKYYMSACKYLNRNNEMTKEQLDSWFKKYRQHKCLTYKFLKQKKIVNTEKKNVKYKKCTWLYKDRIKEMTKSEEQKIMKQLSDWPCYTYSFYKTEIHKNPYYDNNKTRKIKTRKNKVKIKTKKNRLFGLF